MNNLLKELEALKIAANFSEEGLWTACIDLIQKSYVPECTSGPSRPCEEKDFREYRIIVDRNLRNIRSTLQHMVQISNEGNVCIDSNLPVVRAFGIHLLILIGEHHEKGAWNTAESVAISKELSIGILELYGCQTVSQFLAMQDNFTTVLLTLRPKLLKDTWKNYPAAVSSYKWILHQVEKPILHNHIGDTLPTALIIVDDYVPENVVLGVQCLTQIIQHSHMKKGLIDSGYAKVILHALKRLAEQREARYIVPVYSCLTNLLSTMEYWDNTINIFEWTQRDDIISILLGNMQLEHNVELRCAYMQSLPQLLTNAGCAKWCERLTGILCEYCEHHTDLRTLKATLETAKAFLILFHLRVAAHCVPLYTAFLKLHFDLTETPVFDKEIMQNLEDCICLLYKLSPNVGCAIINDDRMRSVIKNSLQVVCLGDTKYFQ